MPLNRRPKWDTIKQEDWSHWTQEKKAGRTRDRQPINKALNASLIRILTGLEDYWPLTVRQVYYQLISGESQWLTQWDRKGEPSAKACYDHVVNELRDMRLYEEISMDCIADTTRQYMGISRYDDLADFVGRNIFDIFDGDFYQRDLLQGQGYRIEIVVEKDGQVPIIFKVSEEYCIPVLSGHGFSSLTSIYKLSQRVENYYDCDQKTLLLYFGDFDPSGWTMLPSVMTTLDYLGCGPEKVKGCRVALLPEQIKRYSLQTKEVPIKKDDKRSKKFIEEFGEQAYELDAFHPSTLQPIVEENIRQFVSLDLYNQQRSIEAEEQIKLKSLKAPVVELMETKLGLS